VFLHVDTVIFHESKAQEKRKKLGVYSVDLNESSSRRGKVNIFERHLAFLKLT
jgi:hypothetical protein